MAGAGDTPLSSDTPGSADTPTSGDTTTPGDGAKPGGAATPGGASAAGDAAAPGGAPTPGGSRLAHPGELTWNGVLKLAVALALGIGAVDTLGLIAKPLALLVVAITIAEALAPVVDRLNARMGHRTAIIVGVYLGLLGLVAMLAWLVVPALVDQGRQLARQAPAMMSQAQAWVGRWNAGAGTEFAQLLASWPERLAGFLVSLPVTILSALVGASLVAFISVYWLIGGPTIRRFTLSLLPAERRAGAGATLQEMGEAMGGYVRGAVINGAILGALAWLGLTLIGLPYAAMLGVLTMAGEMIPVLGIVVVGGIVVIVALLQSWAKAFIALVLFTALVQLEGQILAPNVMRRQTHVPQALVLFAIVLGGALGGFLGLLVSIPLAAAIRVLVLRVVSPGEAPLSGETPAGP